MKAKREVIVATLAALVLTMSTACTAQGDESAPSTPPSESVRATPDAGAPSPTATPEDQSGETVSLDGLTCDDLVPLAVVQANFSEVAVPAAPTGPAVGALPGPAARQAAERSSEELACAWAFPGGSDGGVAVYGLMADEATQATLLADLRSAGSFAETNVDGATSFTRVEDSEIAARTVGYLFDGPVWLAFVGNSPIESFDAEYAPAMLQALRSSISS